EHFPLDLDAYSHFEQKTPLNTAHFNNLNDLAAAYLQILDGNAPNTKKRYFSKLLAHSWAVENGDDENLENYPHIKSLNEWVRKSAINELVKSLEDFFKNNHVDKKYWPLKQIRDALHVISQHPKQHHKL